MKIAVYIAIIISLVGCKSEFSEMSSNQFSDLTQQEIDLALSAHRHEKNRNSSEYKILEILELEIFEKLNLAKGDVAYQLKMIEGAYDQYVQIIDCKKNSSIEYKIVRYKFWNECNPLMGSEDLSIKCFKDLVIRSGTLDRPEMDTLIKNISDYEFWELTKEVSRIHQRPNLLCFIRPWSMKGVYLDSYSSHNGRDTTIVRVHEIFRDFPESSRSFTKIINEVIEITLKE